LFSTEWTKSELSEKVGEFLMGHGIDPNSYKKLLQNEPFVSRVYGSYVEHIEGRGKLGDIEERNKALTEKLEKQAEEIAQLRGQFETILKTKVTKEN
jgi:hemerythrin-like domain-containing protein